MDKDERAPQPADADTEQVKDPKKRDLLLGATASVATAGTLIGLWPFLESLQPSREIAAERTTRISLTGIAIGTQMLATWQGRPLLVVNRTPDMIAKAEAREAGSPREPDSRRVKRPQWLVLVGVCTHLGCVPGFTPKSPDYLWLCACHGSQYDFSGRVIKGPAPLNLEVPPYRFLSDNEILVGEE